MNREEIAQQLYTLAYEAFNLWKKSSNYTDFMLAKTMYHYFVWYTNIELSDAQKELGELIHG